MDRGRASFAVRAPPLPPSNDPGFSFEKVETPLVNLSRIVSSRITSGQPQVWYSDLGPQIARLSAMLNLSAANLIGGLVFGSIGFVAFIYGKRMNLWKPMLLGIALMVYPYFVSNDAVMIAIGAIGTAGLFFLR
jgi:hypothetical protein